MSAVLTAANAFIITFVPVSPKVSTAFTTAGAAITILAPVMMTFAVATAAVTAAVGAFITILAPVTIARLITSTTPLFT